MKKGQDEIMRKAEDEIIQDQIDYKIVIKKANTDDLLDDLRIENKADFRIKKIEPTIQQVFPTII